MSDFNEVNRLKELARVWGFLKYYHRQVATGPQDWDSVPFATIPGLRVDVEVHPTLEIIREGRGEVVERAIEIVKLR